MKSNRIYILLLLTIFAAFIPALVLRDFNPLNELNYLGIAQESLERGTFFAFYQDGSPYADKPPFYLWLCMGAVWIAGKYAMPLVLLASVIPFIALIALLDRYLAYEFRHQERLLIMLGMCSLLVLDVCALVGRMDMLFTMVMLLAYVKIIKRYSLFATQEQRPKYGNLSIPCLLFLALFIKGPYGLLFPLLSTLLMLALQMDIKSYFALIRPYYFIIMLLLSALWAYGVYLDGGTDYLQELFLEQSVKRLGAIEGAPVIHQEPFYFFLKIFVVMTLPIGLCAIYFAVRQLYLRETLELKISACLSFVLVTLVVLSIPKSKLEIYLLPALPMTYYYVILSYRAMQLKAKQVPALEQVQEQEVVVSAQDEQTETVTIQEPLPQEVVVVDLKVGELVAANELPALNNYEDEETEKNKAVLEKAESPLAQEDASVADDKVEIAPPSKHQGLEIVGSGYFLSGINTVGERTKLPKILTLALALPLLVYIALFAAYFVFYDKVVLLQNMLVGISFSVLSCISLVALFFLLSRLFIFSLAALGVGTLSFVLCLGLAMPHLNPFIGVGTFASIASNAIDAGASNVVCAYRYRDGLDMSFYDSRIVLKQEGSDLEQCLLNKATIILNRKGIKDYPHISAQMKEQGAVMLGETLVLGAKCPEPTLPVNAESSNLSKLQAPSQLKISVKPAI